MVVVVIVAIDVIKVENSNCPPSVLAHHNIHLTSTIGFKTRTYTYTHTRLVPVQLLLVALGNRGKEEW